jgi:hypothetical protein
MKRRMTMQRKKWRWVLEEQTIQTQKALTSDLIRKVETVETMIKPKEEGDLILLAPNSLSSRK